MRAAALLLCFGCSAPVRVETNAPAEVEWVSMLELGADGAVGAVGPLARWDEGGLPVFASSARALTVLGYGDDQITPIAAGAPPSVIASEPLRVAAICDPKLPAPIWSGRWDVDASAVVPATLPSLPALTASWLDASCTAPDDIWVDVRCQDIRCAVLSQLGGCSVDLDLDVCGFGKPNATLTANGGLCVDFSATSFGCRPLDPPEYAAARSACDGPTGACELTWYTEKVTLDARERRIVLDLDQRMFRANNADAGPAIGPTIFNKGYAWDLAVVGHGALVTGPGREPRDGCEQGSPSTIYVLDGDRASHVATATAPPCLMRMATSADGQRVLGTFIEAGQWRLGWFDARGNGGASVLADPRPSGDATGRRVEVDDWFAVELLRARTGWIAVWRGGASTEGSLVYTYDENLAPLSRFDIVDRDVTGAVELDNITIVLVTNESGEVIYADRGDGSTTRRVTLTNRSEAVMLSAQSLYNVASVGDELLVTSGIPGAIYTIGRSTRVDGFALVYDRSTTPHAAVSVPWRPDTMLVTGVTPPRGSTLSLYIPSERRFLPGTRDLSIGVTSRMVVDRQDRIWILLGWSGEILILDHP